MLFYIVPHAWRACVRKLQILILAYQRSSPTDKRSNAARKIYLLWWGQRQCPYRYV